MNLIFILFLIVHIHSTNSNLESLASVIRCATGLDYFRMFDTYNSYGCWCGYGGSGEIVDEIDKCCQFHDKCWESSSCSWFQKYFGPSYNFKCLDKRGRSLTLEQLSPASSEKHRNDGPPGDIKGVPQCVWEEDFDICTMQLCSCDRIFAECLAKLPVPDAKRECDGEWRPLDDVPNEKRSSTATFRN